MIRLLCFLVFSTTFFTHAQVSLDLELVCDTEDVCGQELWTGETNFSNGKVNIYVNDIINYEDEHIEVIVIQSNIINTGNYENPQNLELNYESDTLYNGLISSSDSIPFIIINGISIYSYPGFSYSLSFILNIEGTVTTQTIDVFKLYAFDEDFGFEIFRPDCFEYIVDENYVYNVPDTFFYCNQQITNINDFCGQILNNAYIFDGLFQEIHALVFSDSIPSNINAPEANNHYVGMLPEMQFIDESSFQSNNYYVKLYLYNIDCWSFECEEQIWYEEIPEAQIIPIIQAQICEEPDIDLDFSISCISENYCAYDFWNERDLSVYLNTVNGSNTDSVELTIIIPDEAGISSIEMDHYTAEPNFYNWLAKTDTLYHGKVLPSDELSLFDYVFYSYEINNIRGGEFVYFHAEKDGQTAVYQMVLKPSRLGVNPRKHELPCEESVSADVKVIHNFPDTLEYCGLNDLEFCMVTYPGGSVIDPTSTSSYLLVFEEENAPEYIGKFGHTYGSEYTPQNHIPYEQLPFMHKVENWAFEGNEVKKVYKYQYIEDYDHVSGNFLSGYQRVSEFESFHIKLSSNIYYEILPAITPCFFEPIVTLPNGENMSISYFLDPNTNDIVPFSEFDGLLETLVNSSGCDSLFYTPIILNAACMIDESSINFSETTIEDGIDGLILEVPSIDELYQEGFNITFTWLTDIQPISPSQNIIVNEPDVYILVVSVEGYEVDYIIEYIITDCDLNSDETLLAPLSACEPISIGGEDYETVGEYEYIQELTNQYGCDSIVSQIINIHAPDEIVLSLVESCEAVTINDETYNTPGTYEHIQNLNNQYGCDSIVTQEITILLEDEVILAPLSACETLTIDNATYDIPGEYEYTQIYTNQYGCDSVTWQLIEVFPQPEISINEGNDTIFATEEMILLEAFYENGFIVWSNGESNNVIIVSESGNYEVVLSDDNSCGNTATVYVDFSIVNRQTPPWATAIQLFPNPASDFCNISNIPASVQNIKVYTIDGKIIEEIIPEESIKINTFDWRTGCYFIQFISDNQQFSKRIIKY